ncbi:hypothetical protein Tco_0336916 [Tanacetum coccineum]
MCDKNNNVLFTDTECVVLSFDFKLLDESQVLLRVPRKNNMYSVDLKNIVPSRDLTCLFAKRFLKMIIHVLLVRKESNIKPLVRPRLYPVTILNTLDHLGKFDGKADEGFFVGYSVNRSGPEWLFDIDTLTKSMNYKPVVAGNQANGNAGTKESIDAGQAAKKKVPGHEYILLPLCTSGSPISSSPKSSDDEVADDTQKKSTKAPAKEDDKDDQDLRVKFEREFERLIIQGKEAKININSTNNINTGSLTVNTAGIEDNVVDENVIIGYAHDPNIPELEDTCIFGAVYDDEDFVAGGDMNNLESTMFVRPIAPTRIHKNHPVEQRCAVWCTNKENDKDYK